MLMKSFRYGKEAGFGVQIQHSALRLFFLQVALFAATPIRLILVIMLTNRWHKSLTAPF
jgi:hypothetical protein